MKNSLLTIIPLKEIRDLQKFVSFSLLGSFSYGSKEFYYPLFIELYAHQDGNYYLNVIDNVNKNAFWARFDSSISFDLPFLDLRLKLLRAYNSYLNDLNDLGKGFHFILL